MAKQNFPNEVPNINWKIIGKNIQNYRKMQNLRQEDLADRLHLSADTISDYENGYRDLPLNRLLDICSALSVSPDHLLQGTFNDENRSFSDFIQSVRLELEDEISVELKDIFDHIDQDEKTKDQIYRYELERKLAERTPKI